MTNNIFGVGASTTPVKFIDSSLTPDVSFSPKALASGAFWQSARYDLGTITTPRTERYQWFASFKHAATPTAQQYIQLLAAFWDEGANFAPGGVGTTDAAYSVSGGYRNLMPFGDVIVQSAAASTAWQRTGELWIPAAVRYFTLVVYNIGGSALTNVAADHLFHLFPVYDQIQ